MVTKTRNIFTIKPHKGRSGISLRVLKKWRCLLWVWGRDRAYSYWLLCNSFLVFAPHYEFEGWCSTACHPFCYSLMNEMLDMQCSKEEVYTTMLHQMHPCKAPGPDGMNDVFYQRFWYIVGDDVATLVIGIIHGTRPLTRLIIPMWHLYLR